MLNIETPTLLLDKDRCLKNIKHMTERATHYGISLRPHFKTAQSLKIGLWYKDFGVDKITVSSLLMAEYFADDWKDITVAFPVNILEINRINRLAEKLDNLQLLVEDSSEIEKLNTCLVKSVNILIKIDSGTGRSGIKAEDISTIKNVLSRLEQSEKLKFIGFLTHAGHSYKARGLAEIIKVHNNSTSLMRKLKATFINDYPELILSVGDTPTCSIADDWAEIDEWRAGNFTFFDLMQWQIGSCSLENIAVALACPIVAKHADRLELVLYGGGVHLSKDSILLNEKPIYGLLSKLNDNSWNLPETENYIRSLSQEHGLAKVSKDFFDSVSVGDVLTVLPVHSCLTADSMKTYMDFEGNAYDHFIGHY